MPGRRPIRFRLLASLPADVTISGVRYRLEVGPLEADSSALSKMWQFRAVSPAGYWLLEFKATEASLQTAIYKDGFDLDPGYLSGRIMEKAVANGIAEVLSASPYPGR